MKKISFCILLSFACLAGHAQVRNGEQTLTINGTELFFDIQGKGKPLLIIHGGPGLNHWYFLPYLKSLAKSNRLIFYDQRACGLSATPSSDSVTLNFLVNDIEAIRKKLKVNKLQVMAHSWGALLAVKYAIKYPDKIERMILCNPMPLSHEYDVQMAQFAKDKSTKKDSLERAKIYHSASIDVNNYERLMKMNFKPSMYNPRTLDALDFNIPASYLASSQVLMAGLSKDLKTYNFYPQIKNFRFKVLIITGKYDGIPMESVTRLSKLIRNSQLYVFQKSGHFPFAEEPDLFTKVVNTFLKRT